MRGPGPGPTVSHSAATITVATGWGRAATEQRGLLVPASFSEGVLQSIAPDCPSMGSLRLGKHLLSVVLFLCLCWGCGRPTHLQLRRLGPASDRSSACRSGPGRRGRCRVALHP